MVELSNNIYAAFGVFGFIIIGMGIAINYVIGEKKAEHEEIKEERKANLAILSELKDTMKSIEIMIKTMM
jgi:hypothetical protein